MVTNEEIVKQLRKDDCFPTTDTALIFALGLARKEGFNEGVMQKIDELKFVSAEIIVRECITIC